MSKLCWICKTRTADSLEHMFKASDIKLNYGKISPEKKVYRQINFGVKKEVLSIRDKNLLFTLRFVKYVIILKRSHMITPGLSYPSIFIITMIL